MRSGGVLPSIMPQQNHQQNQQNRQSHNRSYQQRFDLDGIRYDTDLFFVDYQIGGANLLPDITVIER